MVEFINFVYTFPVQLFVMMLFYECTEEKRKNGIKIILENGVLYNIFFNFFFAPYK